MFYNVIKIIFTLTFIVAFGEDTSFMIGWDMLDRGLAAPFLVKNIEDIPQTPIQSKPIERIKRKYEVTIEGIDSLFYPAKNPKKLWIIFGSARPGLYSMWSWFWDYGENWSDTAYLFLKDDSLSWYLGSLERPLTPVYTKIINYFITYCGLTPHDVCVLGGSMGGYGALYYGITMGFKGAFVLRPQVDWQLGQPWHHLGLGQLREQWVDLAELVLKQEKLPLIYIQYGNYQPDIQAAQKLIQAIKSKFPSLLLIQQTANNDHANFWPSKNFIEHTISLFELH